MIQKDKFTLLFEQYIKENKEISNISVDELISMIKDGSIIYGDENGEAQELAKKYNTFAVSFFQQPLTKGTKIVFFYSPEGDYFESDVLKNLPEKDVTDIYNAIEDRNNESGTPKL